MKYVITESQDNKMVEKLTNSIKSDGWVNTAKLVGGDENLTKVLGITSPMDFLHLFDDMYIVCIMMTLIELGFYNDFNF